MDMDIRGQSEVNRSVPLLPCRIARLTLHPRFPLPFTTASHVVLFLFPSTDHSFLDEVRCTTDFVPLTTSCSFPVLTISMKLYFNPYGYHRNGHAECIGFMEHYYVCITTQSMGRKFRRTNRLCMYKGKQKRLV